MQSQHTVGYGPSSGYPPSAGTDQFGYPSLPGSTMMSGGTGFPPPAGSMMMSGGNGFPPPAGSMMMSGGNGFPVNTGGMMAPGGPGFPVAAGSMPMSMHASQKPSKVQLGVAFDPDTKPVMPTATGKQLVVRDDLNAQAYVGDIVKGEIRNVQTARFTHTLIRDVQQNLKKINDHLGIVHEPEVVLTDKAIGYRPTILKEDRPTEFKHPIPEVRARYVSDFQKFVGQGFNKTTAHFAAEGNALAFAQTLANPKSLPQAQQPQLPPPQAPVSVLQDILALNAATDDALILAWAASHNAITKSTKQIKKPAERTFHKNMTLFGFTYFCKRYNQNPFIDITDDVRAQFAQFKADNGFPAQDDWDGTMA